jgi:hypothetical protein
MRSERHPGQLEARRSFRHLFNRRDRPDHAKQRGTQVGRRQARLVTSERLKPAACLCQRHAHKPASALAGSPPQRDHRCKCSEITRRMVERLARQLPRALERCRSALLRCNPGRRLHETVEASSFPPPTDPHGRKRRASRRSNLGGSGSTPVAKSRETATNLDGKPARRHPPRGPDPAKPRGHGVHASRVARSACLGRCLSPSALC